MTSPQRDFAVISHRADAGDQPENTLLGIEAALAGGADAIEIDVRATADGELVLLHDEDLRRVAGNRARIDELTLADLEAVRVVDRRQAHPPQPVPTLRQALDAIGGRAAIVIDFVDDDLAGPIADLVTRTDAAGWTWYTPHGPRIALRLHEACPAARTFLGWTPDGGVAHAATDAVALAARLGMAGVMANYRAVDRTAIEYAHSLGLMLTCWTVNDPARMAALVRLGVGGITTDYPALLVEVMRRAGVPRMPPRRGAPEPATLAEQGSPTP